MAERKTMRDIDTVSDLAHDFLDSCSHLDDRFNLDDPDPAQPYPLTFFRDQL